MPLVKIDIYKGKSPEYKKALLDGIHEALLESFHIPVGDRSQRLREYSENDFERSSNKSENFTIIEIIVFKGRSREAKRKLYSLVCEKLKANPGIDTQDILITIIEPELVNWGIKGLPADELDLGFKIDV